MKHIHENQSIWWIVKIYFKRYKIHFLLVLGAVTVGVVAEAGSKYMIKLIFDKLSILEPNDTNAVELLLLVLWLFGLYQTINLGYRTSGFLAIRLFPKIRSEFRLELFGYLRHHSQRFFADTFAGSLANKINQAGRGLDNIYGTFIWSVYNILLSFLISLGILASVSIYIAIIAFSLAFIYFAIIQYFVRKGLVLHERYANARSATTWSFVDAIGNMWNVISFARGKSEHKRMKEICDFEIHKHRASWRFQEYIRMFNDFSVFSIIAVMTAIGIWFWSKEIASVGDVIMILMLTDGIAHSMRELGRTMVDFSESSWDIRDALKIIGTPHDIQDKPNAKTLAVSKGDVSIRDISFWYPNTNEQVFNNLSLEIKCGEKIALVGPSGSGKSTFVRLLLRMYDIQKGSIQVDTQDITQVTQDSLRQNISVVPQEPELFHRSLRENISYPKPDASDDEIIQASKQAYAHDFIKNMPHGYESMVGEKGVKLSGGQRQRIAIARAILKNAPILILDEATSALDSESEYYIQQALDPLMEGKTVMAVAHRLSTISHFDRILVFKEGNIVENGTHTDLINQNGVYAELWKRQSGGFLGE